MDSAYSQNIATPNKNVAENRLVLSKIIETIRFCGKFELAFRGYVLSENSENFGNFRGLNYSAELDKTLKNYLQSVTVFKGTFKEIQNDFLEAIADERNDVSLKLHIVFVFCC